MKRIILLFFFFSSVFNENLMAQSISASQGGGNYLNFQSRAALLEGGTSLGNIQLQLGIPGNTNIPNWKITVQVTGPITQNGTSLAPQYISLQHNPSMSDNVAFANAIRAPTNYIPLGFQEITLIPSAASPLKSMYGESYHLKYNLKIQGGQHLVNLQNGSYPVNLLFRLYDGNGILKSSSTTTYGFGKYFTDPNAGATFSLSLVNGAQNVNLNFSSDADYQSGVSVNLPNGLRVISKSPYQIKVKSNTANFTSQQTSIIPVNTVRLVSSPGSSAPSVTYSTINLSEAAQILLRKQATTNNNPVYYSLRYFTTAGDNNFLLARSGIYTTILYFSIEPI